MTQQGERVPRRRKRTGRRGGDSGTREAILAAARRQFGEHGYDRATIRAIAAEAGVDAALVHHFYGTKERLFAAAMRLPVMPGDVVAAALAPGARPDGRSQGEHLLRAFLRAWDVAVLRATFLGLLRSAVSSKRAAAMLREFAAGAILGRVADAARAAQAGAAAGQPGKERQPGKAGQHAAGASASGADADFRAALVASQVLGLAVTRYVLELPAITAADADALAAAIGPTLERYLSGDLRPPAARREAD